MTTHQFGVIQRHDHTQVTDSQTCYEPAGEDIVLVLRARLDNNTDTEYHHRNQDRGSPTSRIREITVDQRSQPGSQFENGGQQGLLDSYMRRKAIRLRGWSVVRSRRGEIEEPTFSIKDCIVRTWANIPWLSGRISCVRPLGLISYIHKPNHLATQTRLQRMSSHY